MGSMRSLMIIAKSLYRVLRSAIGLMLSMDGVPFLGMGAILAARRSSGTPEVYHVFRRSVRSSVLAGSSNRIISEVRLSSPGALPVLSLVMALLVSMVEIGSVLNVRCVWEWRRERRGSWCIWKRSGRVSQVAGLEFLPKTGEHFYLADHFLENHVLENP